MSFLTWTVETLPSPAQNLSRGQLLQVKGKVSLVRVLFGFLRGPSLESVCVHPIIESVLKAR